MIEKINLPQSVCHTQMYYSIHDPKTNKLTFSSRNYKNYIYGNIKFDDENMSVLSSSDINDFFNLCDATQINCTPPTFKKNDKVYFSSKCSFPALLLNRMPVDIKRTTRVNTADYIIIDKELNWNNYVNSHNIYLYNIDQSNKILNIFPISNCISDNRNEFIKSLDYVKKQLEASTNLTFNYTLSVPTYSYEAYNDSQTSTKYVSTYDLISYVYSQVPPISDAEYSSIISMLTAKDQESVIAGYNLLQYVNFLDKIPDLFIDLTKEVTIIPSNVAIKYICYILGINMSHLQSIQNSSFGRKLEWQLGLTNNIFIMNNTKIKDRVFNALRSEFMDQLISQNKSKLDALHINLVMVVDEQSSNETGEAAISEQSSDENGETAVSY